MEEPAPEAPPRERRLRIDAWLAVRVHASLWLLLGLLVLLRASDGLFPGLLRPYSVIGLGLAMIGLLVVLWRRGRSERIATLTLHSVSLLAACALLAELLLGVIGTGSPDAQSRFPYPYRMHGYLPGAKPDTSVHHCTTNDTGLRESGPIPKKPAGELRVLVLGGSAIFGHGSGDAQTPPAFLQGLLDEQLSKRPLAGVKRVRVINAGQGWYTSTNELVFLVTELILYEPDVVVVVDGYNDAHHAAAWGNRPPANAVTSAHVALLKDAPNAWRRASWQRAAHDALSASRLLDALPLTSDALISGNADPEPSKGPSGDLRFLTTMKHRLVMNWTLIRRLGQQLGFRTLFALQPCIYDKRPLADSEQTWVEQHPSAKVMREAWSALREHVAREAKRLELPVFASDRYIATQAEAVFTDYCHMLPAGNQLLAKAAAERLATELAQWPWQTRYDGVRYRSGEGDPIWRPLRLADQAPWR